MFIQPLLNIDGWWIIAAIAWTLPWKGYALWKAARGKHNFWFIALFLINTLAILDILYIFVFSRMHKKRK
jgi:methionyl-tRNA synthetase